MPTLKRQLEISKLETESWKRLAITFRDKLKMFAKVKSARKLIKLKDPWIKKHLK